MAFVLRDSLVIGAPVALVWEVIADLPRYPEWNPFVVGARSSLVVGEPISMRVRLFPRFTQPQRETVLECVPQERLVYGITGAPWNSLCSLRRHELRPEGSERTHYCSHFELDGWLAPLTRTLLGTLLERGFSAAAQALKDRAEHLSGLDPSQGGPSQPHA
jgi:uncharacterized protein YndB with AHSA1/START domain